MSATIRKWKKESIEWAELAAHAESGQLQEHLQERDEITYTDKNGDSRTVVAAKVTPNGALFILKDMAYEARIRDRLDGNDLSWEGADLRRQLNSTDLELLPDDLAAVITPRKITQVIGGKTVVTDDKLWLPSATELFGKGSRYAACDGPDEEQLPIFQTEGDRVKCLNGETWWYWSRSPLSSSASTWCLVGIIGSASSNDASISIGVAFGFLIGSEI